MKTWDAFCSIYLASYNKIMPCLRSQELYESCVQPYP